MTTEVINEERNNYDERNEEPVAQEGEGGKVIKGVFNNYGSSTPDGGGDNEGEIGRGHGVRI